MLRSTRGSSGGANGSLSMITIDSASPRTSMPSQKLALPTSTALPAHGRCRASRGDCPCPAPAAARSASRSMAAQSGRDAINRTQRRTQHESAATSGPMCGHAASATCPAKSCAPAAAWSAAGRATPGAKIERTVPARVRASVAKLRQIVVEASAAVSVADVRIQACGWPSRAGARESPGRQRRRVELRAVCRRRQPSARLGSALSSSEGGRSDRDPLCRERRVDPCGERASQLVDTRHEQVELRVAALVDLDASASPAALGLRARRRRPASAAVVGHARQRRSRSGRETAFAEYEPQIARRLFQSGASARSMRHRLARWTPRPRARLSRAKSSHCASDQRCAEKVAATSVTGAPRQASRCRLQAGNRESRRRASRDPRGRGDD